MPAVETHIQEEEELRADAQEWSDRAIDFRTDAAEIERWTEPHDRGERAEESPADESFAQWFGEADANYVMYTGRLGPSAVEGLPLEIYVNGAPMSHHLDAAGLDYYREVYLPQLLATGQASWRGAILETGEVRDGSKAELRDGGEVHITFGERVRTRESWPDDEEFGESPPEATAVPGESGSAAPESEKPLELNLDFQITDTPVRERQNSDWLVYWEQPATTPYAETEPMCAPADGVRSEATTMEAQESGRTGQENPGVPENTGTPETRSSPLMPHRSELVSTDHAAEAGETEREPPVQIAHDRVRDRHEEAIGDSPPVPTRKLEMRPVERAEELKVRAEIPEVPSSANTPNAEWRAELLQKEVDVEEREIIPTREEYYSKPISPVARAIEQKLSSPPRVLPESARSTTFSETPVTIAVPKPLSDAEHTEILDIRPSVPRDVPEIADTRPHAESNAQRLTERLAILRPHAEETSPDQGTAQDGRPGDAARTEPKPEHRRPARPEAEPSNKHISVRARRTAPEHERLSTVLHPLPNALPSVISGPDELPLPQRPRAARARR